MLTEVTRSRADRIAVNARTALRLLGPGTDERRTPVHFLRGVREHWLNRLLRWGVGGSHGNVIGASQLSLSCWGCGWVWLE
ncbi:hypothetical protein GCM10010406_45060 [Streptomyces thermolineatus]|uniref:Uncharacterized protein n=1 Tax=Streptomyces thermolineatus TaxID=44033 RepID=A0ABN3MK39_9ACTN